MSASVLHKQHKQHKQQTPLKSRMRVQRRDVAVHGTVHIRLVVQAHQPAVEVPLVAGHHERRDPSVVGLFGVGAGVQVCCTPG